MDHAHGLQDVILAKAPKASLLAAERRQIIATAEGRGLPLTACASPVRGERIFRRAAAIIQLQSRTTAFSRGYDLPPLCG
jgi:hypothetical protein